ncbi:hypothetical protein KGF56_000868 [Candida oxycetoniae]|uniref:Splicing factor U2AF 23 kDa subunit n=1 Tax=Candida oxycetoniae TaxID=497107 RepID=A0AAI9T0J2_9ASCO|nr:uncharacterized protein KGF56_000868 [Candida oxycetoniae]KAI3406387.2 hypothetical protein KGF56_000868 [Candida oxycetoniae]
MSYNRPYDRNESVSVSCAFYNKIGACRHGEKCSKKHIKPTRSKTLLLANLYQNPKLNKNESEPILPKQLQETLDQFYQDVFIHLCQKGEIASLVVCENENNHLNGNVYVRFFSADDAGRANQQLNQEWFNGKPVHSDLSPVTNFDEARCRAYDTDSCERGEMCNYMHVRQPTKEIQIKLCQAQEKKYLLKRIEKLKWTLKEFEQEGGGGGEELEKGDSQSNSVTTNSLLEQLS